MSAFQPKFGFRATTTNPLRATIERLVIPEAWTATQTREALVNEIKNSAEEYADAIIAHPRLGYTGTNGLPVGHVVRNALISRMGRYNAYGEAINAKATGIAKPARRTRRQQEQAPAEPVAAETAPVNGEVIP